MKKAVLGTDGYLKPCRICGRYIENEMFETIGSGKSLKYIHKKCYTEERKRNSLNLRLEVVM